MANKIQTFWNGEPTPAKQCLVIVDEPPVDTWWCAKLVGQQRYAVEITYGDQVFYIDDTKIKGWVKVTVGKGLPIHDHYTLPVKEVVAYLDPIPDEIQAEIDNTYTEILKQRLTEPVFEELHKNQWIDEDNHHA